MKKVHADRLLKLADFLHALPPEKFNFEVIVRGKEAPRKQLDCGSVACAIGWCPVVFPRLVEYEPTPMDWGSKHSFMVKPIGDSYLADCFERTNKILFGLNRQQAVGLFEPGKQQMIGYASLSRSASSKQVAQLIRRFVARERKKA